MSSENQTPRGPYDAGPGTAHEIGLMIGFMAAFVLVTVVYLAMWKIGNKNGEAKERHRRQMLAEKTNPRNTKMMAEDEISDRISTTHGW